MTHPEIHPSLKKGISEAVGGLAVYTIGAQISNNYVGLAAASMVGCGLFLKGVRDCMEAPHSDEPPADH